MASASSSVSQRKPETKTWFFVSFLDKSSTRSVNDLLANLRQTSAGPSVGRALPANTPSVPPAIREILQIPETPAPVPRRVGRTRFDHSGRRLPAGPPPPRSWTSRGSSFGDDGSREPGSVLGSRSSNSVGRRDISLPGAYLPARGSLIDIVLHRLAYDWEFHRVYNQFYLFYLPSHLKPALIRHVSLHSTHGLSLSDLKMILLPPAESENFEEADDGSNDNMNNAVTYLDLHGSLGRSLKIKEVMDLLFPSVPDIEVDEPQDSWDAAADQSLSSGPSRVLLPNLTHISLALDPKNPSKVSWRQLLSLSSKASSITHLSLAYWPAPCFTPRAQTSVVASPTGQRLSYGGTNLYSHSLDNDWSEALLILRMLSRNLYELEYLDLTGCAPWFKALFMKPDHDYVDWVGSWGKISHLRLLVGWNVTEESLISEQRAFMEARDDAAKIEKHIRAMRAGRGRFITIDRD